MVPGLDSTKEELDRNELFSSSGYRDPLHRRSWTRRSRYEMPIRAITRSNPCGGGLDRTVRKVDAEARGHLRGQPWRLLRSQSCCFRTRIQGMHRAVRTLQPRRQLERLPQLSRDVFRVRSHLTTLDEARPPQRTLTLAADCQADRMSAVPRDGKQDPHELARCEPGSRPRLAAGDRDAVEDGNPSRQQAHRYRPSDVRLDRRPTRRRGALVRRREFAFS